MKNNYTIKEKLDNIKSLIFTKLFYKKARLIRTPFYCRGKRNLKTDLGFTTGRGCRFDLASNYDNTPTLRFGENCRIGDYVHIVAIKNVIFGKNVLIASNVFISDTSHGSYDNNDKHSSPCIPPNDRPLVSNDVIIGDNVWIGENVVILSGVTIGSGCVVGANSVVTKSISQNCIVAGSPSKIIKKFDEQTNKWVKANHRTND